MSNTVSNIIYNNTYNVHNHADCHGIQFGKSNLIQETSSNSEDDDFGSQIEDLKYEMNRILEENSEMKTQLKDLTLKSERQEEEIAELKDRVGEVERWKRGVGHLEVKAGTNKNNRNYNRKEHDEVTLLITRSENWPRDKDTITVSKKVGVNDLIKLIQDKNKVEIGHIVIAEDNGGKLIYNSRLNQNHGVCSLEQLGVEDQDNVLYWCKTRNGSTTKL